MRGCNKKSRKQGGPKKRSQLSLFALAENANCVKSRTGKKLQFVFSPSFEQQRQVWWSQQQPARATYFICEYMCTALNCKSRQCLVGQHQPQLCTRRLLERVGVIALQSFAEVFATSPTSVHAIRPSKKCANMSAWPGSHQRHLHSYFSSG